MASLRGYTYASYEDVPIQARALFTLIELVEVKTCPDPRHELEKLFGVRKDPPPERRAFPWVKRRKPSSQQAREGSLKRRMRGLPLNPQKLRKGGLKAKLRAARKLS